MPRRRHQNAELEVEIVPTYFFDEEVYKIKQVPHPKLVITFLIVLRIAIIMIINVILLISIWNSFSRYRIYRDVNMCIGTFYVLAGIRILIQDNDSLCFLIRLVENWKKGITKDPATNFYDLKIEAQIAALKRMQIADFKTMLLAIVIGYYIRYCLPPHLK